MRLCSRPRVSWLLLGWPLLFSPTTTVVDAVQQSTRLVDILNHEKAIVVDNDDDDETYTTNHPHDNNNDDDDWPLDDDEWLSDDILSDDGYDNDVQVGFLEQSLDHFRLSDKRTFRQRYFYTDRYVSSGDNKAVIPRVYAFLCVGGEGPALTKAVLIDSVHCTGDMLETARRLYQEETDEFSIHLFALEHRYYGKSYPTFDGDNKDETSPVSNQNLVYLSSRQAQADLAHFVATQNVILGNDNIPWITFGGSYPGVMAAYARLRFPHYIAAAVSSSAPVQPLLEFSAYKNHVAKVLNDTAVGGSPACLQVFVDGHQTLATMVQDVTNHEQLAADFGLCRAAQLAEHPRNVEVWLGDGVVQVGTQGNDPACNEPLCNIAKKCGYLLQERIQGASPVQALAALARQELAEGDCINLNWEDAIQILSNTTNWSEGWRSWLWQTCTEFGFYQTCRDTCPFGRGFHPLSQDLEICRRAFGVSAERVARAVQESIQYYGGWHLGATRVLSVNGNVDPWSELALLRTHTEALPAFVVPGASHHFWTHAVKNSDALEIVGARELIFATIVEWLEEIDTEWSLREKY